VIVKSTIERIQKEISKDKSISPSIDNKRRSRGKDKKVRRKKR
jgi:hypothetical protein